MKKTLILLAMVVALMILPFFINHGGEFGGSDGEAESQIQVVAPDYQPWFQPLYEPASGEIESLLFTLQGSLGAAVIFYILGYARADSAVMTGFDRLSYQSRWLQVAPEQVSALAAADGAGLYAAGVGPGADAGADRRADLLAAAGLILALVPLDGAALWLFAGRRADHSVQRQPRPADAVSELAAGRFLDRDFRPGAGRGRGDLLAQPGGDGGHALAGAESAFPAVDYFTQARSCRGC
jgi:cobalt/nickel transport protein